MKDEMESKDTYLFLVEPYVVFVNEELPHENHVAQPRTGKWLN